MLRSVLIAVSLALAAPLAQAQVGAPPAKTPIPGSSPSASVNPPTMAGLKPGMPVKDSTGAMIGVITHVGQTTAGKPMVGLKIDDQQVVVPAGDLTVSQATGQAVTSMTKAQLQAAATSPG